MLHTQTVEPATLALLKKLQSIPQLSQTRLVGGTALALQYGHRISVDLDFFGKIDAEDFELNSALNSVGEVMVIQNQKNIKSYFINRVKVDIVNYPYPFIDAEVFDSGLTLASDKDISAMKLAAITGRGSKKDFIDLYFILKKHKLNDVLDNYLKKYPDGTAFMVLKSLIYFDDAELSENTNQLIPIDWEIVKSDIVNKHNDFINSLK